MAIESCSSLRVSARLEPCGCHGLALVKGRSGGGKKTSMGLNTFSRLTRDGKFMSEFIAAANARIKDEGVAYSTDPRPQWHIDWAEAIVRALCPGGEDVFWTRRKNGTVVPKPFLDELRALLSVVNVANPHRQSGNIHGEGLWIVWVASEHGLVRPRR